MMHVQTRYLWVQEMVKERHLEILPVRGKNNPADLFTKILGRSTFEKHRATVMNTAADERKSDKPSSAQTKSKVTSAGGAALGRDRAAKT